MQSYQPGLIATNHGTSHFFLCLIDNLSQLNFFLHHGEQRIKMKQKAILEHDLAGLAYTRKITSPHQHINFRDLFHFW
jgi:hypothetical protein